MQKKNLKFIFLNSFFIILFLSLLIQAQPSQAGTKDDMYKQLESAARPFGIDSTDETTLATVIQLIITALLSLLGIIFIVLIVYAGYNWMTAGGSEDKVALAKSALTRAVIGLIIIVAAYSITYFVFSSLPGRGTGG